MPKPKPKRRGAEEARAGMEAMASSKRRRVGDIPDISEGVAAEPEAAGGEDREQQEVQGVQAIVNSGKC